MRLDAAVGAHVELHGKSRKKRVVPLWAETARVLRAWFRELGDRGDGIAFPSARGQALSRDGIDYLLRQAVTTAALATKERALAKLAPMPGTPARYRTDDKLLAFLAAL